ncbi:MAG: apolipoprotein acyltransferase [Pseudomonadota bacterium]
MIVIACGAIGVVLGWYTARKRGGNRWDMAQYAAGYGIAFVLLGLVVTVLVHRAMV